MIMIAQSRRGPMIESVINVATGYRLGADDRKNQLDRHLRNAYYMYSHNRTKETDMKTETLDKMQKYGGSFVMQLARLWFVADQGNRDKLEAAFGDVFDRYENMGDA